MQSHSKRPFDDVQDGSVALGQNYFDTPVLELTHFSILFSSLVVYSQRGYLFKEKITPLGIGGSTNSHLHDTYTALLSQYEIKGQNDLNSLLQPNAM